MEMANQHSSDIHKLFSLMKTVNHCWFVITAITSSEGFNSMVFITFLNKFCFLTLKQGEVSTLCEINEPISVAVTANNTILAGSASNKLFKVTHQGEFTLQPFYSFSFDDCDSGTQHYGVSLLAGSGTSASADGRADECSMTHPRGLVVHEASHSCFVVDYRSHKIRKVTFVNPM
jgi:hypothetical protein